MTCQRKGTAKRAQSQVKTPLGQFKARSFEKPIGELAHILEVPEMSFPAIVTQNLLRSPFATVAMGRLFKQSVDVGVLIQHEPKLAGWHLIQRQSIAGIAESLCRACVTALFGQQFRRLPIKRRGVFMKRFSNVRQQRM